jgi:23S rRNA (uracil1939-C5)-methyltransferase
MMSNREISKLNCPYQKKCGGCLGFTKSYAETLREKEAHVRKLLEGICRVERITGMEDPLHYRNKVHAAFGWGVVLTKKSTSRPSRGIVCGLYQESTHKIVPIESCLIEDEAADSMIRTVRELMPSFKLAPYDEVTRTGVLRHVLVRHGFQSGQVLVTLVTAGQQLPSAKNLARALVERHPEITTIVQNINDKRTSMILGDRSRAIYGRGYIEDTLCGLTFRISPSSFYQVNPVMTEKLYGKALELAGLIRKETVLDAYCGIGTIGLIASKYAGHVIGVELNPAAVKDAKVNMERNGITNAEFHVGDAGEFLERMAGQAASHIDVVMMDPPRTGATETFIRSVAKMAPKKVVYISCGPDTLARDLRLFKKLGYSADKAYPFDMFPFTEHVEVCVSLSLK